MSHLPTSSVLGDLFDQAHTETVTLGWLVDSLEDRSFGIVLLLLALLGLLPGVSLLAGVLLVVPAFEMILGRRTPIFGPRFSSIRFTTHRAVTLVQRVAPVLVYLERYIRPRWPTPFKATKRIVGVMVLLLASTMFIPIPLSNLAPSFLIAAIAFAYLEEDGVLLFAALGSAVVVLAILLTSIWETIDVVHLIPWLT